MNVKEYISSGIIESYVLGLLTEPERQDFETVCAAHPEVAHARDAFERSLEDQLVEEAYTTPVQLKAGIFEKMSVAGTAVDGKQDEEERAPVRSMGIWKWLAAASLILLAGAAYWAYTTRNQNSELRAQNEELNRLLQHTTARMDSLHQDAQLLQRPDVKMAAIKSEAESRVYATVYWDTTSRDVYLLVNNLPKPAPGKAYQLWALLENGTTPVDLGMIRVTQERLLYKMKNVQGAAAFAITLEPEQGSPQPTSAPVLSKAL